MRQAQLSVDIQFFCVNMVMIYSGLELWLILVSLGWQDQVLFFLKDIFDLEKVRYTSVEMLAEDMLHLLHRRSELLLAYLGADSFRHLNGCVTPQLHLVPNAMLEARVQ